MELPGTSHPPSGRYRSIPTTDGLYFSRPGRTALYPKPNCTPWHITFRSLRESLENLIIHASLPAIILHALWWYVPSSQSSLNLMLFEFSASEVSSGLERCYSGMCVCLCVCCGPVPRILVCRRKGFIKTIGSGKVFLLFALHQPPNRDRANSKSHPIQIAHFVSDLQEGS